MIIFNCAVDKALKSAKMKMEYFINSIRKKGEGKEVMNIIEIVLNSIASIMVETTSWFGLYEPKIPRELVKSEEK